MPLHCLWDQGYCILNAFLGHFFFYYIKMWQVGKKRNLAYLIIFPYLYTQLCRKSLSSSAGLPYESRSFSCSASQPFFIHHDTQRKKDSICLAHWCTQLFAAGTGVPAWRPKGLSSPEHTLEAHWVCHGRPAEISARPHFKMCCVLPHFNFLFSFFYMIKDFPLLPLKFFHKLFNV